MSNEYDFALHYRVPPDEDPETYIDALFDEGCDDSMPHFGKVGYLEIDFIRVAGSASEAISSAIEQVKIAIPNSEICYISPDIVGVSEIAKIMGCSRQYVRQLINENPSFPIPIHSQNKSIWHLIYVLEWLKDNNKEVANLDNWIETAKFVRVFNNKHNREDIDRLYEPEAQRLAQACS